MDQPVNQPVPDQGRYAIGGFVLGIIGLFGAALGVTGFGLGIPFIQLVGLILSIIGLRSSKRGWAIAGVILCTIGLLLSLVFLYFLLCHLGGNCIPFISDWLGIY